MLAGGEEGCVADLVDEGSDYYRPVAIGTGKSLFVEDVWNVDYQAAG